MHRVNTFTKYFLLLLSLYQLPLLAEEEPSLPLGLGGSSATETSTDKTNTDEPSLPLGLGLDQTLREVTDANKSDSKSLPFNLSGFFETRAGVRYSEDPFQKRASIGESRLQLKADTVQDWVSLGVTADFLGDAVANDWPVELESGDGFLDLREAFGLFRFGDYADLKVGRQILTWGTGDFIFINDLFPKDYNSFFNGRDDEYLKAPSDSIKLSTFFDFVNADIIYSPNFDSDRYIDGRKFSFYSPAAGTIVGGDDAISVDGRNDYFKEDEFFGRLYRDIASYELALYGYYGYWKSPAGFNPLSGQATFPRLAVYGASARGPLGAGIANFEFGYYDSRDDSSGDNPFVNNSELRYLVGYEQELLPELTGGFQYYLEQLLDYDQYQDSLPAGSKDRDEFRHLLTLRLTKLLLNQNLRLSLFTFYSPSDEDMYARAHANYKITDRWQAEVGTNLFLGAQKHTFFGMFEDASNIYLAARYSFVN